MSAVASDLPGTRAAAGVQPATASVGVDPLNAAAPPPEPAPDGPDAVARLAESRERLRRAMAGPPPRERAARASRKAGGFADAFSRSKLSAGVHGLLDRLRALPAAEVVVDAVQVWWAGHPLHTAGSMAADASKAYVQPYARRNPIALVVGSAVVGALFFLTKPWRWALRPVLLAGLVPQIVSQALRRAPIGSWMDIVTALAKRQAGANRPRAARATTARSAGDWTEPFDAPHAATPAGPGSARPPSVGSPFRHD